MNLEQRVRLRKFAEELAEGDTQYSVLARDYLKQLTLVSRYGQHDTNCPKFYIRTMSLRCTCGFEERAK